MRSLSSPSRGRHRLLRRVGPPLIAGLLLATSPSASATKSTTPPAPSTAPVSARPAQRATFGIAPVNASPGGGRPYFSYDMGPGGTYADKVAVLNYGSVPLHLNVFAADLTNASDGSVAVGLASATPTDAGAWIHLPNRGQSVSVAAATAHHPGQVILPFRLAVPGDAIPGDHAAAIVASLSTLGRNPKGENIRLDQRIAARVYLRVSGVLHPALAVENLTADYEGTANPFGHGRLAISYRVHNVGNVRLGARQQVTTFGWFGAGGTSPAVADVPLLLPGASVVVHTAVTSVFPSFRLHTRVRLFPLTLQTDANPAVPGVSATVDTWAVPWTLVALVLVVLAGAVALLLWRRRRRSRPRPTGPAHSARRNPAGARS